MKLLVDGVCFQLSQPFRSSVWASILACLAGREGVELLVLDRGSTPAIDGAVQIDFPPYKYLYTPDDSFLIQTVCDHYGIDVFVSTHCTSAISTPTLVVVTDVVPEAHAFVSADRRWSEREIAIGFARHVILASNGPLSAEFRRFYPETPADEMQSVDLIRAASSCGPPQRRDPARRSVIFYVDDENGYRFYREAAAAITAGELVGFEAALFADLVHLSTFVSADVREALDADDIGSATARMDDMLDRAVALVCPRPVDGYELLCAGALMRGCPVIGCADVSVDHVADAGVLRLDDMNVGTLTNALVRLRDAGTLEAKIGWNSDALAERLVAGAETMVRRHKAGAYDVFFGRWAALRELQSCVDEATMY